MCAGVADNAAVADSAAVANTADPYTCIHIRVGARDGALLVASTCYVAFTSIGTKLELVMYKSTDAHHRKHLF